MKNIFLLEKNLFFTYLQFLYFKIVHNSLFSLTMVKMDLSGFASKRFKYSISYKDFGKFRVV